MSNRHTSLATAIVFVAYVSATSITLGQTQTKPADQDEPVRLRTELVQVQVVVTDKQGKVVEHLKKADFEILEQGRPQEVSFFSLERIGVKSNAPAPEGSPVANPPTSPADTTAPSRSIVLF